MTSPLLGKTGTASYNYHQQFKTPLGSRNGMTPDKLIESGKAFVKTLSTGQTAIVFRAQKDFISFMESFNGERAAIGIKLPGAKAQEARKIMDQEDIDDRVSDIRKSVYKFLKKLPLRENEYITLGRYDDINMGKYLLNAKGLMEFKNKSANIEKGLLGDYRTSDAVWFESLEYQKYLYIEMFKRKNTKGRTIDGGLFKHLNDQDFSHLDLSRYGIWKTVAEGDYCENCFIRAMRILESEGRAPVGTADRAREFVKNSYVPMNKFNTICKALNIRITVTVHRPNYSSTTNRKVVYGKTVPDPSAHIFLGNVDRHYFLDDRVPKEFFAGLNRRGLRNYTSYHLIKRLFVGKHFTPIDKVNEDTIEEVTFQNSVVNNVKKNGPAAIESLPECPEGDTRAIGEVDGDATQSIYDPVVKSRKGEGIPFMKIKKLKTTGFYKVNRQKWDKIIAENRYPALTTKNFYFDFEAIAVAESKTPDTHTPYMVCVTDGPRVEGGRNPAVQTFIGPDCAVKLLEWIRDQCHTEPEPGIRIRSIIPRLIAHNFAYDYQFILPHFDKIIKAPIEVGTKIMGVTFMYKGHMMIGKDSLSLIPGGLKDFKKFFKSCEDMPKEVFPYDLYDKNIHKVKSKNVKKAEEIIKKSHGDAGVKIFRKNLEKWGLYSSPSRKKFDHIGYAQRYCESDTIILARGYEEFREMLYDEFGLNADRIHSIASVADKCMRTKDVYDGVLEISGLSSVFIRAGLVGGRVMTAQNRKIHVKGPAVADFDACSLYPSAIAELGGFLKGAPKKIPDRVIEVLNTLPPRRRLAWMAGKWDGYFVQIRVNSVGIKRDFPLFSRMNDKGSRIFTNDWRGRPEIDEIVVGQIALEDAVEFQDVDFTLIRGEYFDEGRNMTVGRVIRDIYNRRRMYKKAGSNKQLILKLLMNSSYGKTIEKPRFKASVIKNSKAEADKYLEKNCNYIECFTKLADNKDGGVYEFKVKKTISKHFSRPQCGMEILEMSKRIMNRVMCLAEDCGIQLYYQDTDSIHMNMRDVDPLSAAFSERYGRARGGLRLIGKDMGQFHCDFDGKTPKDTPWPDYGPFSTESIFLGKKVYLDMTTSGPVIRMKGVSTKAIEVVAAKTPGGILGVYKRLFAGESMVFNLVDGGPKFKRGRNKLYVTLSEFNRKVSFPASAPPLLFYDAPDWTGGLSDEADDIAAKERDQEIHDSNDQNSGYTEGSSDQEENRERDNDAGEAHEEDPNPSESIPGTFTDNLEESQGILRPFAVENPRQDLHDVMTESLHSGDDVQEISPDRPDDNWDESQEIQDITRNPDERILRGEHSIHDAGESRYIIGNSNEERTESLEFSRSNQSSSAYIPDVINQLRTVVFDELGNLGIRGGGKKKPPKRGTG